METLTSKLEAHIAQQLLRNKNLDRHVLILSAATEKLFSSQDIPRTLQVGIMAQLLRILTRVQDERNQLDICYARAIDHPNCQPNRPMSSLGELWDLPAFHELICETCWKPLYKFYDVR